MAERARVNVTRRIAAALQKIAAVHPAAAHYLETTVRTGTACVYLPDPRIHMSWTVHPPALIGPRSHSRPSPSLVSRSHDLREGGILGRDAVAVWEARRRHLPRRGPLARSAAPAGPRWDRKERGQGRTNSDRPDR